jgi:hypothetical protein
MHTIGISKLETMEDIYDLVRYEFSNIKDELNSSSEEFYIAFDDLGLGIISLSALTMLTCFLYSIRKKYEYPFIGYFESHQDDMFYADPKKSSFLKASNFIDLTQYLRIIDWHLVKDIPENRFNPNTGIQLIDVPSISENVRKLYKKEDYFNKNILLQDIIITNKTDESLEIEYEKAKTDIKYDIKEYIYDDINKVFSNKEGRDLKNKVISYSSELILNSFIHGRVNPFLAVQRTDKKINITICDDGIGLVKSFHKLHKKDVKNKQAIINACKHRINDSYGLFDVFFSVLGIDKPSFGMNDSHHGFVTISDDAYILTITRNNFKQLIESPNELKIFNSQQKIRGVRISLDILIK